MKHVARHAVGLAILLGFGVAATWPPGQVHALPASDRCAMSNADRLWIEQALANWRLVERRQLRLAPSPLPTIVAIDAKCAFTAKPGTDDRLVWDGAAHGETVTLPDGKTAPVGEMAFAAPSDGAGHAGFFVMSLPSVWRAAGVTSSLGLERLMDGVLLHEMMHTRQFYFVNPMLAGLTRRYNLPDDISDDSLQDAFKSNPAYVAAYEKERDLLFAAAAAPTNREARLLARRALAAMRERRATWLAGEAVKWAALDDIFLDMEGLGQWTSYAWFAGKLGPRLAPAFVLPQVRRGGGYWTQDEGLALFLVVDRLLPGWRRLAFAPRPALAESLLARAAAG